MYISSGPLPGSRRSGISEVLGALLLIIVVVVAVASLASFVAIAQANAQNRSSFITNLKNENLQVTFAQFKANATKSLVTPRSDPSLWNNVTLTIRNTNTANSQLAQIKAGTYWFVHWNEIDLKTGHVTLNSTSGHGLFYGVGRPSLLIPAKATTYVLLNFTANKQTAPPRNGSLSVTLITSAGNFFVTVYSPPTALGKVGLGSVSYQYFSRDIVTLDGSLSQGSNGSQIASYIWTIAVPKNGGAKSCGLGAFAITANYTRVTVLGRQNQFFQESKLSPLTNYCLAGPFKVGFSVIDTRGMIGNASTVVLTSDPNMAPMATLSATPSTLHCPAPKIAVTVQDVFGRNVGPATILASHSGDLNASSAYSVGSSGQRNIFLTCVAGGSITLTLNGLPSVTLSFVP